MIEKLKKFFIGLILAALAISGCTRSIPAASSLDKGKEKSSKGLFGGLIKAKSTPTPPGDYVMTINVDGEAIEAARTRSYTLHVPATYDGGTSVGLLVAFHQEGGSGQNFEKVAGFQAFTDPAGMIVVYPDAYGEKTYWNTGISAGTDVADDVLFIKTLLGHMEESFNINPKRIYFSGYSNGGVMAYQAAGVLADQVAAVAAVGSAVGYRSQKGTQAAMISVPVAPVSVLAIHGMKDDVVPYGNESKASNQVAGFTTFSETEAFFTSANGCPNPVVVKITRNENIIKHTWDGCNGSVTVQTITINSAKHGWPTGVNNKDRKGNEIAATETIMSFFATHPKP